MAPGDQISEAIIERERRQLGRLETLMDVMYALMLFTVVSEIPLPDPDEDWVWTLGSVGGFIAENGSVFVMTIVGIILLVIYWVQNNLLFGNLARTNTRHAALAIAQLSCLMFYAYSLKLGEVLDGAPGTLAFQSIMLAALGFTGVAGWSYAMRDRRLLSDAISDKEARELRIGVLPEPITATLTIPIAFIGPWMWELSWLLLIPIGAWLRRREARKSPSQNE